MMNVFIICIEKRLMMKNEYCGYENVAIHWKMYTVLYILNNAIFAVDVNSLFIF